MGDQLVARTLLTAPGDCDEVGGMNGFWQRKPKHLHQRHFAHHKSPLPDSGANPGRHGGKPATNRFSYGADLRASIVPSSIPPIACPPSWDQVTAFLASCLHKPNKFFTLHVWTLKIKVGRSTQASVSAHKTHAVSQPTRPQFVWSP
jgi:hypothetical protein